LIKKNKLPYDKILKILELGIDMKGTKPEKSWDEMFSGIICLCYFS